MMPQPAVDEIAQKVLLVQTDTTVGFLSQNALKLTQIKERPNTKPFVQVCASLKDLKAQTRVAQVHKNRLRRAKRTTFIHKANAIRVVKEDRHARFIKPYGWFYSTSANEKGLSYEKGFAFEHAQIIVEDNLGLFEGEASRIYKLGKTKMKRLR